LEQNRVRVDATTVSGYHAGGAESLFQFGKRKDNPGLLQVKVMQGVLAPLALVGDTAAEMRAWIQDALNGKQTLTSITIVDDPGQAQPLVQGYETTRACTAPVGENTLEWTERVWVVYSETYAKAQQHGLEQRLATATAKLKCLTPPRGRGKRQIKDEAQLRQHAQAILHAHRVEGLLSYTFERQVEQRTQFVGRGRGAANRLQRIVEQVRYQITAVIRHAADITALKETFGWRAYATDLPAEDLKKRS